MKTYLTCLFILTFAVASFGQKLNKTQLDDLSAKSLTSGIDEFKEFLSLPNNGLFPDHIEMNMVWCESAFSKRGFSTQRIQSEGPPLLLATKMARKADKTVLIYLQVDGQPVDSSKWDQESPYIPILKEAQGDAWKTIDWKSLEKNINPDWRIFARSASDAKGPIIMFLKAMDILNENKWTTDYNIKVILDFEEELGSPNLPAAVTKHKELLKSDMLIIYDGPMHPSNEPTLTFGARGIATVTLKVYGPKFPQHSGHYGNYVPNPALRISQLLASMKDDDGRVTIAGWYDGIMLDQQTKTLLTQVPDDEVAIRKKIGIKESDKVGSTLQEAVQYPSLNIRGLSAGWVEEEVRTIIPSEAIAEIDVRLVPESNAEALIEKIRDHIKSQGYYISNGKPSDQERMMHNKIISFDYEISYDAFRTHMDSEVGQWLERALIKAFDKKPIKIRIAGGSIPISPFVTTLNVPAVSVPTVNPDNNQHSPNENLRLGNLQDGIKTYLAILLEKL